ncbi:P27 family phage terminase small subunit [Mesorhizobium sp. BR-1-1-8]|uniref:P27 family phage terminase small subunit n=1 Tax=Mesorhizobium sp. BR-1-1-8 TaxID=2876659 RepID=UPI001CC9FF52|nr:P27 family phage terminase small subunit [Mesorhizobium sp. BR-1-1-8]MBZ9980411.1 P27 family phage terminase small subunit [Mesorhizobium sp. BR-1-1-8]
MVDVPNTPLSAPDWSKMFPDPQDAVEASDQWGAVMADLSAAGTLADANGHTVVRLVEFRVQYRKAAKHVAEHGAILTSKRAKVGQWNPYWSAMQQADARIVVLESKLGLDPVSRGKTTKVARGKKTARAADAYLKPASE